IGQLRFRSGDYHGAVTAFSHAVLLSPTEASFGDRAVAAFYNGEYELAIRDCTEVISRNPDHARAFFLRSVAYERLGIAFQAAADREVAFRLNPSLAGMRSHPRQAQR
ncbi:MAG: tetratricopeptide repeat protein, partial [Planctomycetaceae bacterium]